MPSDHAPVIVDLDEAPDGDIGPVVPPPSAGVPKRGSFKLPSQPDARLGQSSTTWLTIVLPGAILNYMVEDAVEIDVVFHALGHSTRRAMLARLDRGELTVGELAEPLTMSLAAASKHVKVLERAGLVRLRVEGRRHVCRLDPAPLASAAAWLRFYERHWSQRLDALEALFRADSPLEKETL